MDLAATLTEEQVNPGKLLDALASINGTIGGNVDLSTEQIPTPEDTLQPLQDSLRRIEEELANFFNAFPSTPKPLVKDKKAALAILSPDLGEMKKEIRLPCRPEVKSSESKKANEAWISFRNTYLHTASALYIATMDMQRATREGIPETVKWEVNETKEVSDAIKLATDRLLLAALVVSHVYSLCLTKAQMEITYKPYSEAFEELKAHKIKKRLKTIRRRAASSKDLRREAMVLLEEEERRYWQKEDKWQEEQSRWTDRGMNMGLTTWRLQQKTIDKALGTSILGSLLPAITTATKDLIKAHLDFIPDIRQLESQLANHEEEAEEISETLYKELSTIRDVLGAQASPEDTKILEVPHSTPKGKHVTFTPREECSLLLHDITSLEGALRRLREQFDKASRFWDDQSMEMLKATLETVKARKGTINLVSGSSEEVKEAYTLLDEVDVEITKVPAYISLEDRRERKRKEDEKTKGIMAAKSLPNTRIPTFTGKLEDFWEWLPQFQAACPSTLPPEIRTCHLRQAVRDPATLDVISG